MRKKSLKLAALSVCAVLSAAMICGCGKKNEDNNSSTTTPAATSAASAGDATAEIASMTIPEVSADLVTTLGDYKGYTYDKFVAEISTEEANNYYKEMVESYAASGTTVSVEDSERKGTPVVSGDTVNIDFVGYMDGVAFDNGSGNNNLTIGSGAFIPGFEDGLIGKNIGEKVTLDLKFPDEYPNDPDKAGKPVQFDVTINYALKTETLSVDNAYSAYFKFETLEECIEDIRKYLMESNTEEQYRSSCLSEYLAYVIEGSKFADMTDKINEFAEGMYVLYDQLAQQNGISIETMISYQGYPDIESFKEELRVVGEEQLKSEAVLLKIAEFENYTVSSEDITNTANKMAEEQGYTSADEFKASYEQRFGDGSFRRLCLTQFLNEKFFDDYATEK